MDRGSENCKLTSYQVTSKKLEKTQVNKLPSYLPKKKMIKMTNTCYYSQGDQHTQCKNKTCIFNERKWLLEKNLAKVSTQLEKCRADIKNGGKLATKKSKKTYKTTINKKRYKIPIKTHEKLLEEESILLVGKMKFEKKLKEMINNG